MLEGGQGEFAQSVVGKGKDASQWKAARGRAAKRNETAQSGSV